MVLPGDRSKSNRSKAETSLKGLGARKNSTGVPDSALRRRSSGTAHPSNDSGFGAKRLRVSCGCGANNLPKIYGLFNVLSQGSNLGYGLLRGMNRANFEMQPHHLEDKLCLFRDRIKCRLAHNNIGVANVSFLHSISIIGAHKLAFFLLQFCHR